MKKKPDNPAGKKRAAAEQPVRPVAKQPVPLGPVLKEARKRKKLTQDGLASLLGVSKFSVRNWEVGANKPDYAFIPLLCSLLDISVEDLFGIRSDLSAAEKELLRSYRLLSPVNREIVDRMVSSVLEVAQQHAAQEGGAARDDAALRKDAWRIIEEIPGGAAAGTGHEIPDLPVTPFFLANKRRYARANGIIRVYGHSMEPHYQDGDLVLFTYTDSAAPGDDVVAKWEEGAIVKRLDAHGKLFSTNAKYPFRYTGGEEGVRIIGKVLGVLAPDDMPDEADDEILYELFEQELQEFRLRHGDA